MASLLCRRLRGSSLRLRTLTTIDPTSSRSSTRFKFQRRWRPRNTSSRYAFLRVSLCITVMPISRPVVTQVSCKYASDQRSQTAREQSGREDSSVPSPSLINPLLSMLSCAKSTKLVFTVLYIPAALPVEIIARCDNALHRFGTRASNFIRACVSSAPLTTR